MKNKKALEKIIQAKIEHDTEYQEALSMAKKNSSGKIWLIGSLVYKTLANELWGCDLPPKDFDFVVENIKEDLILPEGWKAVINTHGNPKLSNRDIEIDLISLSNIHSIKERGLEPDINNFLSGTPLTIQSMVLDVEENALIGDIGIQSLLNKEISINNKEEYEYAKNIYGYRQSIDRYAKGLKFSIT